MQVVLSNEQALNCIISRDKNNSLYNYYIRTMLETMADDSTLKAVKTYNIDLISIFNIKSRSMIFYREKKPHLFTAEKILFSAFSGKPISFFKICADTDRYFGNPEIVFLVPDKNTLDNKLLKKIKRLIKPNKRAPKLNLTKLEKYKEKLNESFISSMVAAGKKDYAFIKKYNEELFNTHIKINDIMLTHNQVNDIFLSQFDILDLSDLEERSAFIALYGIIRGYFSIVDIFSIDGIFSFSENRNMDNKKRKAAMEVIMIFLKGEKELIFLVENIGAQIYEIKPPKLDIDDLGLIKQNYTLYAGIHMIGKLYLKLNVEDNYIKKYAERLLDFSLYHQFYEETNKDKKDYLKQKIYRLEADFM
ncbi:MAG: hypothetical protein LBR74_09135 [Eubacterium sp.]|jgi:hypothetical protein|nr:hypothetical protein [Eubacterium sp.]